MASIKVRALEENLGFGARVTGVTEALLKDESARTEIRAAFENRGLVVFEDVEPSARMHVALSLVFGPLKEHPVATVTRVDQDNMPGVIDMRHDPERPAVVEIDGKPLSQWLPWHFDHCYNNELNRAGVLRAIEIPPEGGMTGFLDGVELYRAFSPELRARIEERSILYTLDLRYSVMRFGRPANFRELVPHAQEMETLAIARSLPRAIHPAVWTRATGEKVMHVSPWMAVGVQGHEDPEGDALLAAVCAELEAKANPYFHAWKPTDMVVWDNWRMLHRVSGHDPKHPRRMQRTTIKGDYGLGAFEDGGAGHKILEMTV